MEHAVPMQTRWRYNWRDTKLWLPFAVLLFSIASAKLSLAQDSAFVRGLVLDLSGQPLQGAQLQVLPAGPRAVSDPDGAFVLGPLISGIYHIRVRRIGFAVDTVILKLPRGGEDWVIHLSEIPRVLDPIFSSALEQDLPRVMDRMRQHMGATVFGPELMKQYPGLSVDEILATDSTVFPFMREASVPRCHPWVYLNGKLHAPPFVVVEYGPGQHLIMPDLNIRSFVRMKDIAVIEVYRFERRQVVSEPWYRPRDGTECHPTILIWTKDFKQKPYKGH